ncbi:uncharacterized protein LOC120337627 [Styela clava]
MDEGYFIGLLNQDDISSEFMFDDSSQKSLSYQMRDVRSQYLDSCSVLHGEDITTEYVNVVVFENELPSLEADLLHPEIKKKIHFLQNKSCRKELKDAMLDQLPTSDSTTSDKLLDYDKNSSNYKTLCDRLQTPKCKIEQLRPSKHNEGHKQYFNSTVERQQRPHSPENISTPNKVVKNLIRNKMKQLHNDRNYQTPFKTQQNEDGDIVLGVNFTKSVDYLQKIKHSYERDVTRSLLKFGKKHHRHDAMLEIVNEKIKKWTSGTAKNKKFGKELHGKNHKCVRQIASNKVNNKCQSSKKTYTRGKTTLHSEKYALPNKSPTTLSEGGISEKHVSSCTKKKNEEKDQEIDHQSHFKLNSQMHTTQSISNTCFDTAVAKNNKEGPKLLTDTAKSEVNSARNLKSWLNSSGEQSMSDITKQCGMPMCEYRIVGSNQTKENPNTPCTYNNGKPTIPKNPKNESTMLQHPMVCESSNSEIPNADKNGKLLEENKTETFDSIDASCLKISKASKTNLCDSNTFSSPSTQCQLLNKNECDIANQQLKEHSYSKKSGIQALRCFLSNQKETIQTISMNSTKICEVKLVHTQFSVTSPSSPLKENLISVPKFSKSNGTKKTQNIGETRVSLGLKPNFIGVVEKYQTQERLNGCLNMNDFVVVDSTDNDSKVKIDKYEKGGGIITNMSEEHPFEEQKNDNDSINVDDNCEEHPLEELEIDDDSINVDEYSEEHPIEELKNDTGSINIHDTTIKCARFLRDDLNKVSKKTDCNSKDVGDSLLSKLSSNAKKKCPASVPMKQENSDFTIKQYYTVNDPITPSLANEEDNGEENSNPTIDPVDCDNEKSEKQNPDGTMSHDKMGYDNGECSLFVDGCIGHEIQSDHDDIAEPYDPNAGGVSKDDLQFQINQKWISEQNAVVDRLLEELENDSIANCNHRGQKNPAIDSNCVIKDCSVVLSDIFRKTSSFSRSSETITVKLGEDMFLPTIPGNRVEKEVSTDIPENCETILQENNSLDPRKQEESPETNETTPSSDDEITDPVFQSTNTSNDAAGKSERSVTKRILTEWFESQNKRVDELLNMLEITFTAIPEKTENPRIKQEVVSDSEENSSPVDNDMKINIDNSNALEWLNQQNSYIDALLDGVSSSESDKNVDSIKFNSEGTNKIDDIDAENGMSSGYLHNLVETAFCQNTSESSVDKTVSDNTDDTQANLQANPGDQILHAAMKRVERTERLFVDLATTHTKEYGRGKYGHNARKLAKSSAKNKATHDEVKYDGMQVNKDAHLACGEINSGNPAGSVVSATFSTGNTTKQVNMKKVDMSKDCTSDTSKSCTNKNTKQQDNIADHINKISTGSESTLQQTENIGLGSDACEFASEKPSSFNKSGNKINSNSKKLEGTSNSSEQCVDSCKALPAEEIPISSQKKGIRESDAACTLASESKAKSVKRKKYFPERVRLPEKRILQIAKLTNKGEPKLKTLTELINGGKTTKSTEKSSDKNWKKFMTPRRWSARKRKAVEYTDYICPPISVSCENLESRHCDHSPKTHDSPEIFDGKVRKVHQNSHHERTEFFYVDENVDNGDLSLSVSSVKGFFITDNSDRDCARCKVFVKISE